MKYAGFWIRFCAAVIDSLVFFPIGFVIGLVDSVGDVGGWSLVSWIVGWLYFSLMESSGWQATLGKRLVGIRVTDLDGKRITFGRATGRYFSKILSWATLYIGYFMVAFTAKKQGLHDMLAGTLVLYGKPDTSHDFDPPFEEPFIERVDLESNSAPRYVIAGFDSNGHVVRLTFRSDDDRLDSTGLIVGRDSRACGLIISDNSISRVHARIFKENGEIFIEDLGSTNGTTLEGYSLKTNSPQRFPSIGNVAFGDIELSIGKY